jgi:hypothetical protein
LDHAEKILNEATDRVLSSPGANDIGWSTPKNRDVADQVRIEIGELLERLK